MREFAKTAWPGLLILVIIVGIGLRWLFGSAAISQPRSSAPAPDTQTITTSQGSFRVPGVAFIDGRAEDTNGTIMQLNVWDGPSRQRGICQVQHGERVSLLGVQRNTSENRYYFRITNGPCSGWVPDRIVSEREEPMLGDLIP